MQAVLAFEQGPFVFDQGVLTFERESAHVRADGGHV